MTRRTNTDPLRKVIQATQRSGQGGLASPQYFAIRWWQLDLECGHEEERTISYPGSGRGFARQHHPPDRDAPHKPAPKKVRCSSCARDQRRAHWRRLVE